MSSDQIRSLNVYGKIMGKLAVIIYRGGIEVAREEPE
jgi:hypothetical protein